MKRHVVGAIAAVSLTLAATQAMAWQPVPPTVTTGQGNSGAWGVSQPSTPEPTYRSNTGTTYRYDLNNHSDRIRYRHDHGAQIRDNINPRVRIDRDTFNQHGGGAYR